MYKDKDSYKKKNYNTSKIEELKNKQKKITSTILALILSLNGTICLGMIKDGVDYHIEHTNPFSGGIISSDMKINYQSLQSRRFLVDESYDESIQYIKNSGIDEKKAYALYYALIRNESLNNVEKKTLKNAIKYFCDNPYIDYEYIYNQLIQVKIVERNAKFTGTNISSTFEYTIDSDGIVRGGEIRLGNEEDIYHEFIMHGISRNHHVSWIEEGYASIIDAEYNNNLRFDYNGNVDIYPVETNIIRFLCELIGKNEGRACFFKIAADKLDDKETPLDLLSSYLTKAGVSITLCEKLYAKMDDFSKYMGKELSEEEQDEVFEILKSITGILSKMYEEISNNKPLNDNICSSYLYKILHESYTYLSSDKFYYFNSEKINEYPEPVTVIYFYPFSLSDEIMRKRDELKSSTWPSTPAREINGKEYIAVYENEFSMCDKSKIIEYKKVFLYDCSYEYMKDNESNSWKYISTESVKRSVEYYLKYYNDSPVIK